MGKNLWKFFCRQTVRPISNLKATIAHFIFKIYSFDCFHNLFFIFTKIYFFLYFWEVRISFSICIVIFLMSRLFHLFTCNFFLLYFFLFLLSFLHYPISPLFFTFSLFLIVLPTPYLTNKYFLSSIIKLSFYFFQILLKWKENLHNRK